MREWLRRFVIPSFPLGALLALGLFGVGFVFAFPDDSYQWLWELVIAVAIILWVLGAGFFASLGQPNNIQETPQSYKKSTTPSDNKQDSKLSPSFSALVDAINAHSRANIAEESKEDNERSLRERITIILLAITMVAIIFQVVEMKRVYEPIAEQAKAAHDNIVADHRAWVGPIVQMIDKPTINQPVTYTMQYGNSGKQPAPLITNGEVKTYTLRQWNDGEAGSDIDVAHDDCFNLKDKFTNATIVAFPTSGFGGYAFNIKTRDSEPNKLVIDQAILDGNKIIAVITCFRYMAL